MQKKAPAALLMATLISELLLRTFVIFLIDFSQIHDMGLHVQLLV